MNIVSDPPDETPEELKARLLRCPKLKAAVCKVARSKGVHRDEEEDVYQETMHRMSTATLPPIEAEARKYVHGIAKNVAIDHVMKRAEEVQTEPLESLKKEEQAVRERLDQRVHMKGIFQRGFTKFGLKWDWWVRARVHQQTSTEIGEHAGVTPSHVRDEVSLMNRWFDSAWGKRTGTIGGVFGLMLAIGLGWALTHRTVSDSDLARFTGERTDTRVVGMDASALRTRGLKACDEGAWSACEEDLTAAKALDAEGETLEVQEKRLTARARQTRRDVDGKDGEEMNAKPGQ